MREGPKPEGPDAFAARFTTPRPEGCARLIIHELARDVTFAAGICDAGPPAKALNLLQRRTLCRTATPPHPSPQWQERPRGRSEAICFGYFHQDRAKQGVKKPLSVEQIRQEKRHQAGLQAYVEAVREMGNSTRRSHPFPDRLRNWKMPLA
jgi:hypothetical protein